MGINPIDIPEDKLGKLPPGGPTEATGGARYAAFDAAREKQLTIFQQLPPKLRSVDDVQQLAAVINDMNEAVTAKNKAAEAISDPVLQEGLQYEAGFYDETVKAIGETWPEKDADWRPSSPKMRKLNALTGRLRHILGGQMLPEILAGTRNQQFSKKLRDGRTIPVDGRELADDVGTFIAELHDDIEKGVSVPDIALKIKKFFSWKIPDNIDLQRNIVTFLSASGIIPSNLANIEKGFVRPAYNFFRVYNEASLLEEIGNVPTDGLIVTRGKKRGEDVKMSGSELKRLVTESFATLRAEVAKDGVISEATIDGIMEKKLPPLQFFKDACEIAFKRARLWPGMERRGAGARYQRYQANRQKSALELLQEKVLLAGTGRGVPKTKEAAPAAPPLDWKSKVEEFNTSLARILNKLEVAITAGDKKEASTYFNTLRELAIAGRREARRHGDKEVAESILEMEEFAGNQLDAIALMQNGIEAPYKEQTLMVAKRLLIPQASNVSGELPPGGSVIELVAETTEKSLEEREAKLKQARADIATFAKAGDRPHAIANLSVFVDICDEQKEIADKDAAFPQKDLYTNRAARMGRLFALVTANEEKKPVDFEIVVGILDQILSKEEPSMPLMRYAPQPEAEGAVTLEQYFEAVTDTSEALLKSFEKMETDPALRDIPGLTEEDIIATAREGVERFGAVFGRWGSPEFQELSLEERRAEIEEFTEDPTKVPAILTLKVKKICEREFLQAVPDKGTSATSGGLFAAPGRRAGSALVRKSVWELIKPGGKTSGSELVVQGRVEEKGPTLAEQAARRAAHLARIRGELKALPPIPGAEAGAPTPEQSPEAAAAARRARHLERIRGTQKALPPISSPTEGAAEVSAPAQPVETPEQRRARILERIARQSKPAITPVPESTPSPVEPPPPALTVAQRNAAAAARIAAQFGGASERPEVVAAKAEQVPTVATRLAELSESDLAKVAATVPDDVWIVALQVARIVTKTLEEKIYGVMPIERAKRIRADIILAGTPTREAAGTAWESIEAAASEILSEGERTSGAGTGTSTPQETESTGETRQEAAESSGWTAESINALTFEDILNFDDENLEEVVVKSSASTLLWGLAMRGMDESLVERVRKIVNKPALSQRFNTERVRGPVDFEQGLKTNYVGPVETEHAHDRGLIIDELKQALLRNISPDKRAQS